MKTTYVDCVLTSGTNHSILNQKKMVNKCFRMFSVEFHVK